MPDCLSLSCQTVYRIAHMPQPVLWAPRVHITRPLARHPRRDELNERVRRALVYFPELNDQLITVGVTRVADGMAIYEDMTVRFDVRRRVPGFYTIGHELTHLLQALKRVPEGEVQCDIWTVAKSRLFIDQSPVYLPLPDPVRREWRRYALRVHYLCGRAISERCRRRYYIRWLKSQLEKL